MLILQKMPEASSSVFRTEPWVQLLEQIDVILAIVHSGYSNSVLRRFGVRRRSAMYHRLVMERMRVVEEIEMSGHAVLANSPVPDVPMALRELYVEFELLAEAFERCAKTLSPQMQDTLPQWLMLRSRMHNEHANFFRTY